MRSKLSWAVSLLVLLSIIVMGLLTSCSNSNQRSDNAIKDTTVSQELKSSDSVLLVIQFNDQTTLLKPLDKNTYIGSTFYYSTYRIDFNNDSYNYVKYYRIYKHNNNITKETIVSADYFNAVIQDDLVLIE